MLENPLASNRLNSSSPVTWLLIVRSLLKNISAERKKWMEMSDASTKRILPKIVNCESEDQQRRREFLISHWSMSKLGQSESKSNLFCIFQRSILDHLWGQNERPVHYLYCDPRRRVKTNEIQHGNVSRVTSWQQPNRNNYWFTNCPNLSACLGKLVLSVKMFPSWLKN